MTRAYKRKLIEVALPLDAINEASVREKSIRHGHPSTLHLWWARRPLATCRAVLFAQLVDDPSSHPDRFPTEETVEKERQRLFEIIEDLVKWENSTDESLLKRARAEIRKSCGGLPPIYDPFSGGCSIPLEAQRLGLPAYGSDLNPVAVMIGKAMVEIPPKFKDWKPIHPGNKAHIHHRNAEGLAEDVRYYGKQMREQAFKRIGGLYPQVSLPAEHGGGMATVIAWIWARTVPSPDPAFAKIQVPIASTFLLSSKRGKEAWVEPVVDKIAKTIDYRIRYGGTEEEREQARKGTKAGRGANFLCLLSDTAITSEHVKTSRIMNRMGQELIAIVAKGKRGRLYLAPDESHIAIAQKVKPNWKPEQEMNQDCSTLISGRGYGFRYWHELFTNRQLVALTTFSDIALEIRAEIEADALSAGLSDDPTPLRDGGTGAKAYAEAISVYLTFNISKMASVGSTITSWISARDTLRDTFSRQAIPMVYDFAETNFFSNSSGNWSGQIDRISTVIAGFVPSSSPDSVKQANAWEASYPHGAVISSDPPYYDNIDYADLSDFFFCWLRPLLQPIYPDLFGLLATPKSEELVASSYRHGGRQIAEDFFLNGMSKAIANMARQVSGDCPVTIYYAYKQREIDAEGVSSTGWAVFLQAILKAGFSISGTWPIRTERPGRLTATGTNALANSVILVCRKREDKAGVITRAEFMRSLKHELPSAIAKFREANISPADMPQSAIGPGMSVFSRYEAVLEANDSPMSVKTALKLINQELDAFLNDTQGDFDADTRFTISWYEQNGMATGDYGVANSIAQARGISVESVKDAGIIKSVAGKVRILKRDELDPDWDPGKDRHLTVWECCYHLIRTLEQTGEYEAATLLKKFGGDRAEAVKDLAYCLYDICANKRQDAKEATAYNTLIATWPELTRLAATIYDVGGDEQTNLDL